MRLPHLLGMRSTALASGIVGLSVAAPAQQSLIETSGVIVAASGDVVPDSAGAPVPNTTFSLTSSSFDECTMDASGHIFMRAQLVDSMTPVTPINDRALFFGSSRSDLRMVVRAGDQAPGMAPGILLRTTSGISSGISSTIRVTADGRMLWGTKIYDGGMTVDATNDDCFFGGPLGGQALLARKNDVAPGTGGATFAQAFSSPSTFTSGMNEAGVIYFQGALNAGTGVPPVNTTTGTNNQVGLWVGFPNSLELVVRKSDPVNGLGGEVGVNSSSTLSAQQQINDSNKLMFALSLATSAGAPPATVSNDFALMVHTLGGGNQILVREGDVAPGTAGGTFNAIVGNAWAPGIASNCWTNSSEIIFVSDLRGGDTTTATDSAVFRGGVGTLAMVLREGDPAPGIGGGASIGGFSITRNLHNSAGQVAFTVTLRDGGVTTANDTVLYAGLPGSLQVVAREGDPMPGTGGSTFSSLTNPQMHFNEAGEVLFQVTLIGGGSPGNSLLLWDAVNGLRPVALVGDQIEVTPSVFKSIASVGTLLDNNGDGASLAFAHDGSIGLRVSFNDSTRALMRVIPDTLPVPYCFGDGTGTFCPCSPAPVPHGDAGKGCPNNLFPGGSQLSATGTASLRGDSLLLTSNGMPNGGGCTFFQGTTNAGGVGTVFGDGLRCANGSMARLLTHIVASNTAKYPDPSFGDNPISIRAVVGSPGTKYYQGWYRSSNPTFCTPDFFNLSNGVQVTWAP